MAVVGILEARLQAEDSETKLLVLVAVTTNKPPYKLAELIILSVALCIIMHELLVNVR